MHKITLVNHFIVFLNSSTTYQSNFSVITLILVWCQTYYRHRKYLTEKERYRDSIGRFASVLAVLYINGQQTLDNRRPVGRPSLPRISVLMANLQSNGMVKMACWEVDEWEYYDFISASIFDTEDDHRAYLENRERMLDTKITWNKSVLAQQTTEVNYNRC